MPGFVEERLVVGKASLGARDQVHDARWVGGDHAGARVLLRPIVEIEADAAVGGEIEPEGGERGEADGNRAFLRVRAGERGEPPHVRDVGGERLRVPDRPEDPVEPALPQLGVAPVDPAGGGLDGTGEALEIDPLELAAPQHRIRLLGELGLERLPRPEQLEPLAVEARRGLEHALPEPIAITVLVEHRELRLRRPERDRLAVLLDPAGQDRVLERVLALGELRGDDPARARLSKANEPLALVVLGGPLRAAERRVLLAREEICVAGDDRRLLARLLLAHTDRSELLGALVDEAREPLLEGVDGDGGRHGLQA